MKYLPLLAALAALGGCVVYDDEPLPRPPEPPLARDEALGLVRAGIGEPVLLELAARRGVEPLDADTLAALKKAGASDDLLQKLITSERRPEALVVEDGPYFHSYYDDYAWRPYYPSVYWGVGFGWHFWGRPSRGIRIRR